MTLQHFDSLFAFVVIIAGLSLLVTVLTQMVSGLFGLRGSNLLWGIKTLLTSADPELAPEAETIARAVLHHPFVSDSIFSGTAKSPLSRWRLGSAIRQEELIFLLQSLAANPTPTEPWRAKLSGALDKLDVSEAETLLAIAPEIQRLLAGNPAAAETVIARLTGPASELTRQIDRWFEPIMDRVAQRFTMHTRLWTVLFSVLLAFALQLDAFALFSRIWTDAELRSRLVSSADALTRKADEILTTTDTQAPAAYVAAMKQLIADHSAELGKLQEPSGFSTAAGGDAWLTQHLPEIGIHDTAFWIQRYHDLLPQAALRSAANSLQTLAGNDLKLAIIPAEYPVPFYKNWDPRRRVLWGILASAALLSLGAPFWFNTLKNLANLRPILAKKEEQERAESVDVTTKSKT